MKKSRALWIGLTILIAGMIVVVAIMMVVIDNGMKHKAEGLSEEAEAFFDMHESEKELAENVQEEKTKSYTIAAGEYEVENVYLSDTIDLAVDDNKFHTVSYESSYENTTEWLPSVYYNHEPIKKNKVSQENFMRSYPGIEENQIFFDGGDGEEGISIPSEIYLYNVDEKMSSSYTVETKVFGNENLIKSIGWSSPDSSKINLSKTSGHRVTISRASDFTGTMVVNIVVTYQAKRNVTATEDMELYVHVQNQTDKETPLLDKKGNSLYLDDEGKNVAHLSDFASQEVFYGDMKIQGWQRINGETFYFNKENRALTGEQTIGGTKYIFDDAGVLLGGDIEKGIDVSLYQGDIDWKQVKDSGISYAIIRCGFRGAVSGSLVEDSYFKQNIRGAKAAGLRVGVYFYTQARTEAEAIEEATMVLALCQDYSLELPIFVDSENMENGRANDLDADTRTANLIAFCETIQKANREAGVYASKYWFYDNVHANQLEKYCIWVAQYATECDYIGKKNYWQYSSQEQIPGINGNVDVNMAIIQ